MKRIIITLILVLLAGVFLWGAGPVVAENEGGYGYGYRTVDAK